MDGTACPANKLVITPSAPVRDGATFTVTVSYTGQGFLDDRAVEPDPVQPVQHLEHL